MLVDNPLLPSVHEGSSDSEPINGIRLLDELVDVLNRYLVLPHGAAEAIALWIVHAHAHDAARISPLLALLSPDRRCGKTTALELIGSLVPRPLTTANITSAALSRVIETVKPTILIDEADTFVRRDQSLLGILNAGHIRNSAFIIRATSDGGVHPYPVWCPKVIAAIGHLPTTLADRAITIRLSRKRRDEVVERLRLDQTQDLMRVATVVARWASENLQHLRLADPYIPGVLNDRAADNWRQLLAIAELAGGEWTDRAQIAAIALSRTTEYDDETNEILLLADIKIIFLESSRDRLRSTEITAALAQMEHRRWPEWRNGRPITPVQMARMLDRFDIHPTTHRFGETTDKGYLLAQFADSFARYT
jgi:putative DNA primase/helicase